MTIEERLDALTMNLELMSRNQEAMQATQEAMQATQADMQATQEAMQATQADMLEDHDKMKSEIKIVLGAQVVMSDALNKLTRRVTELADVQIQADGRMAALILTVDEVIRGGSKPQ